MSGSQTDMQTNRQRLQFLLSCNIQHRFSRLLPTKVSFILSLKVSVFLFLFCITECILYVSHIVQEPEFLYFRHRQFLCFRMKNLTLVSVHDLSLIEFMVMLIFCRVLGYISCRIQWHDPFNVHVHNQQALRVYSTSFLLGFWSFNMKFLNCLFFFCQQVLCRGTFTLAAPST